MNGYEWVIAAPHGEREALAHEARITPWLAQVLLNRGVRAATEVGPFLNPDFRSLLPPEALVGAAEAGRRLAEAVRTQRKIVIYGDYDVDGITATTILWHGLTLAGATVDFYIPSRTDEGYGLSVEALEKIAAGGADLLITVDCGITSVEEARRARALGLELIITDHHEPRSVLPECEIIVHPVVGCDAPANPHLSGAGVALKIGWALAREVCRSERVSGAWKDYLLDATAFAALGLVADVVPLTGENRIITSFGLKQLCLTQNPGLQALIDVSGLRGRNAYDDYDVGFRLAPRLNAVGRLGHARVAVELFTRANATRAREIAVDLDAQNRKRQAVEREIVKQAEAMVIERGYDRDGCHGIVLASETWHAGVIGIVASRLVDRFHRPTVLISLENGAGQGSGRSIRHFPLHEVLQSCDSHLLGHGGHAMAAGVRVDPACVGAFTEAFLAEAGRRLTPADLRPKLRLDDEVGLGELHSDVVGMLGSMAPHGPGNPRPKLASRVVQIVDQPRRVGRNGAHLQFAVREEEVYRKAIAFGAGEQAEVLEEQRQLRLAFEPIINEWNGRRSVELKVIDWRLGDSGG